MCSLQLYEKESNSIRGCVFFFLTFYLHDGKNSDLSLFVTHKNFVVVCVVCVWPALDRGFGKADNQ